MAKGKPRRKMSKLAFIVSFSLAVLFDLLGFMGLPFVGGVFVLALKGLYFLNGYNGSSAKKYGIKGVVGMLLNGGSLIAEWVPVLGNLIPGCISFVLVTYFLNKSSYKERMIKEGLM